LSLVDKVTTVAINHDTHGSIHTARLWCYVHVAPTKMR